MGAAITLIAIAPSLCIRLRGGGVATQPHQVDRADGAEAQTLVPHRTSYDAQVIRWRVTFGVLCFLTTLLWLAVLWSVIVG